MNSPRVNSQIIILARQVRGLTQAQLASAASVTQSYIAKIESGLLDVSDEHLEKIATALRFPKELFFQPDEVRGVGSACNYHRKRESLQRIDWYRITARLNFLRIHTTRLLRGVEVATENNFCNCDLDEFGTPERIAQLVRTSWKLPFGPIANVIKAIEGAGGIVFKTDFGTNKIDAISQSVPGQPPLFLVNSAIPGDRMRFTLAHEIGHIVMHDRFPTNDMETEADKFASEFLMPAADIAPDLSQFSLPTAASILKPYWKVSIASLMRRAKDLNAIDDRAYLNLCKRMSYLGYRKKEPVLIPQEEPSALKSILNVHREHLHYSQEELSKLLHLQERELEDEYFSAGLRILRAA